MTTLLPDIVSSNWQLGTRGVGTVAEGLQDIRQCLDVMLRTVKGTDPLRPEFGSDIYQYIDRPLVTAIPAVKRAIIQAVAIWEQRVRIKRITHEVKGLSTANFDIVYQLVDEELIDILRLQLANGVLTIDGIRVGNIIVQGLFPPNPLGKRYRVSLTINGAAALPSAPSIGFATPQDLYNWVFNNWSGFGQWLLAADRILGYLPANTFDTASLSISLIGTARFAAPVPNPQPGQTFEFSAVFNGTSVATIGGFATLEALLIYVRGNYSGFGVWQIEGSASLPGDFDPIDFSDEFFIGTPASYQLALYTENLTTVTLNINVV